jgi:hypothetical protein
MRPPSRSLPGCRSTPLALRSSCPTAGSSSRWPRRRSASPAVRCTLARPPDRTPGRILRADLAAAPFLSPDADRLRKLGLDTRSIAAAVRAGELMRISDQVVLAPGAADAAAAVLAKLDQPFTAAQARQALDTTRRTAIPLLEYLDSAGVTERLPDDRRVIRARPGDADGAASTSAATTSAASPGVSASRSA